MGIPDEQELVVVTERVVVDRVLVATPGTAISREQAEAWGVAPKPTRKARTTKAKGKPRTTAEPKPDTSDEG